MSNFKCPTCGRDNIDTEDDYAQECDCLDGSVNEPSTEQIQERHEFDCLNMWRLPPQTSAHSDRGLLLYKLKNIDSKMKTLRATLAEAEAKIAVLEKKLRPAGHHDVEEFYRDDVLKAIGDKND